MTRVHPDLIKEWDTLAVLIGVTPKLDPRGEIVAIGASSPKGKTYVVWVGRAVGLFKNWGLTSAMVTAFPGAIHKSYSTEDAARQAWYEGPSCLTDWHPPQPRRPLATPRTPATTPQAGAPDVPQPDRATPNLVSADVIPVRLPARALEDLPGTGTQPQRDVHTSEPALLSRTGHSPLPRTPSTSSMSSLSSVSSISNLSSAFDGATRPRPSVLTSETLSEYDILSPAMSHLSLSPSAPSTPRRAGHALLRSPSPTSPTSAPSTPVSMRRFIGKAAAHSQGDQVLEYDQVPVRKGERVFVVVRGDRPGIYFDRSTALLNAGWNPGMKITAFKSLSQAAWYFVQKYMARQVGVPAVEVSDSDDGDE